MSDWTRLPGNQLFGLFSGTPPLFLLDNDSGDSLYLKVDDFNSTENSNGLRVALRSFSTSKNSTTRTFAPGVIVFPKRGAAIFLNRVQLLMKQATVDPNLMVLNVRPGFSPAWMRYELLRRGLSSICDNSSIPQINNKHLYPLTFDVPPLPEQRKIASILTTVDSLIEQTEVLIEKYRRVKQGMMADLLSRGVDSNGKLRPTQQQAPELYKQSELGWIPREWDVKPIGTVAESLVDGPFGSNLKTEHYVDQDGVRVVRLQNINREGYDDSDKAFVSRRHAATLARNKVVGGDVLIAGLGDESNLVGRCCLYPGDLPPAINKADCFRLRCLSTTMFNEFVSVVLNSTLLQPQLRTVSQGVTRIRVNTGNLKKLVVPVPDLSEQLSICRRLNSIGDNIHAQLEVRAKLMIQKTGLMQDLLTGKVRVKVDKAEEVTTNV